MMDPIEEFYALSQKIEALQEIVEGDEAALVQKRDEHARLIQRLEVQGRAAAIMKRVLDYVSERGIKRLEGLLTYGLKLIFDDDDYALEIELSERGEAKTAVLWIVTRDENGEIRKASLRDSVGGGIQSVVGLILRVYFITQLGLRRFLVLDESLSQVSSTYVEGLFRFLRHVVEDLGFEVLFVTHDPRFLPYVDRLYRVRDGKATEEKDALRDL